jgi:3D-(3,5/4)-trihydroxycyclohexane-1,2-dione acylhydrolase (decyclizing)
MSTLRLTAAQAVVRYLAAQRTVIEGAEAPLFAGVWAIFGHGNVAGLGEALYQVREVLPTFRAHNEQAMAHAAIAFAKAKFRRQIMACTTPPVCERRACGRSSANGNVCHGSARQRKRTA